MMQMIVKDYGQNEWHNMVSSLDMMSLMQTWEYGEAKALTGSWKVSRAIFKQDEVIVGVSQAVIRSILGINRGLVWINRAPLQSNKAINSEQVYINMIKELRKYWVESKKMYLQIAPPVLKSDDGYSIYKRANYSRFTENDGWASAILDLSYSTDEIRKNLAQKWRNSLNKAERLEVSCEKGSSNILMEELLEDYSELLTSSGFKTNLSIDFLRRMQELLPDERKMMVFAGRHKGVKLGSILIAKYGDTCMYLVGATNDAGRKVNANHYLLWSAICEMKKLGYVKFDVGGAHPEHTPPGILRFKKGLSAIPYQLLGGVEAHNGSILNQIIRKRIKSSK